MDIGPKWTNIPISLNTRAIWIMSIAIDGVSLVIWAAVQWLVNGIVERFELSGVDRYVFYIFQVIFALSTLAPVIIHIYTDIRVMIIQSQRRIQSEITRSSEVDDV